MSSRGPAHPPLPRLEIESLCLGVSEAPGIRERASRPDGVAMFSSMIQGHVSRSWWFLNLCHPEDFHHRWSVPPSEAVTT